MKWSNAKGEYVEIPGKRELDRDGRPGADHRGTAQKLPKEAEATGVSLTDWQAPFQVRRCGRYAPGVEHNEVMMLLFVCLPAHLVDAL